MRGHRAGASIRGLGVSGPATAAVHLGLLLGILGVGFVSGLVLQPKLQKLHQAKYGYTRTTAGFARGATPAPAQRAAAEASFKTWHAVSQVINLLTLGGLAVYFWRLANPSDGTRFSSTAKFRS